MGLVAGPFFAAAALLAVGGMFKVRTPQPTARALHGAGLGVLAPLARAMGAAEVVVGAAALAAGGRFLAMLVAAFYAGFSAFVALALVRRAPVSDCGCFGAAESPPTVVHLAVNVAAAAVALAVAAGGSPAGGMLDVMAGQPLAGVPFLLLVGVCTGLAYAALTVLPRTLAETRVRR